MPQTDNQRAYAILSYYERLYEERYGSKPVMNRHRDKWGIIDAIADLGEERVTTLLRFYLDTARKHSVAEFANNYDVLNASYEESLEDQEHRAKLRRQTEERVRRYREQYGHDSRETD